jgi:hypothetical protein
MFALCINEIYALRLIIIDQGDPSRVSPGPLRHISTKGGFLADFPPFPSDFRVICIKLRGFAG